MMKDVLLGLSLGALAVVLGLIFTEKLVWTQPPVETQDEMAWLERSVEAHVPHVLDVGNEQLIYMVETQQTGKNISVNYNFYKLNDGDLERVSLN